MTFSFHITNGTSFECILPQTSIFCYRTVNFFEVYLWRGTQKTWNLSIKNYILILTRLNFILLQTTLYLMQFTYWDVFSTAQTSFWTPWFWCLLVLLLFFVSLLPHQQNVSLWEIFSLGKQKKVTPEVRWGE